MIIVIIPAMASPARPGASDRSEWAELAHAALEEAGHRSGGARAAVIELLAAEACCVSAQEIADRLRERGRPVGAASVYRALDLLTRAGVVARVEVGAGGARYEVIAPGGEHHHHLVCDGCGTITPFSDPALERAIDRVGGRVRHRVRGHEVVLRGDCPRCRARLRR
jgi:Fur family ferric uptake transcriptional regulator